MNDFVGLVLGGLRVDRLIREGSASIWLAHDEQGRPFTVKFLDPLFATEPEISLRVRTHRDVVIRMRHENLVGVIDVVMSPVGIALICEYVGGPSVREYLRSRGTLTADQVSHVGAAVARGLAELHSRSLVHGDIAPDTVLLDTAGHRQGPPLPRIDDVGLSFVAGDRADRARWRAGTGYIAPELAMSGVPSPGSDLYALGGMLWELASGGLPPVGAPGSAGALGTAQPLPRSPGLSDSLWDVIAWLRQADPSARPAHAGLVADAFLGGTGPFAHGAFPIIRAGSPQVGRPAAGQYVPNPAATYEPRPVSTATVPAPAGVHPAASTASGGARRSSKPATVRADALVAVALSGGCWWWAHRGPAATSADQGPVLASSTPISTATPIPTVTETATPTATRTPTPSATPSSTGMSQAQALAALTAARTAGLSAMGVPRAQWILQLSSKADGTTDKLQKTQSGSHTFHLPDIYAQYLDLQRQLRPKGVDVYMLQSSDFGRQFTGPTYWTVVATPGSITDLNSGNGACQKLFPQLTGALLLDTCLPRQYSAPQG